MNRGVDADAEQTQHSPHEEVSHNSNTADFTHGQPARTQSTERQLAGTEAVAYQNTQERRSPPFPYNQRIDPRLETRLLYTLASVAAPTERDRIHIPEAPMLTAAQMCNSRRVIPSENSFVNPTQGHQHSDQLTFSISSSMHSPSAGYQCASSETLNSGSPSAIANFRSHKRKAISEEEHQRKLKQKRDSFVEEKQERTKVTSMMDEDIYMNRISHQAGTPNMRAWRGVQDQVTRLRQQIHHNEMMVMEMEESATKLQQSVFELVRRHRILKIQNQELRKSLEVVSEALKNEKEANDVRKTDSAEYSDEVSQADDSEDSTREDSEGGSKEPNKDD
ncbi:MAG: hypothetical protein M1834_006987 [Cirrosporium novae-zelandiae]|nr:MAG: hypothetical protein M1834_006987 [Cirrosporium novae-zelandiae]